MDIRFTLAAPALAAVVAAAAPTAAITPAQAQTVVEPRIETETETLRLVRIADGLIHPWALTFLPDGRMLVTERSGRLRIVHEDGRKETVTGTPSVLARNQGGLLDVALHPEYERTGWVYLTYSAEEGSGTVTALSRGRLEGLNFVDAERLFTANEPARPGRHYGSRLAFLDDGTLLMSIGERGDPDRSQDLMDHSGSIVRLHDDGRVPEDNPFVGRDDALPEIYSYGHRNPQGLIVHPETGVVWSTEHGPRGGDELNIIEPGLNYGWPVISHGVDYVTRRQIGVGQEAPGKESPLHHWTPAIAPSGLAAYTGDAFPGWRTNLFSGSLVATHLRRLVVEGERVVHEEVLLDDRLGRIRDVRQGPDGFLYLLTDANPGGLYRLEPYG